VGCHVYSSAMDSLEFGKPCLCMYMHLAPPMSMCKVFLKAYICPVLIGPFSILGEGKTHANCNRFLVCFPKVFITMVALQKQEQRLERLKQ
jgi:hypothetical protein